MDRESAEAALAASEAECGQFHVGSDSARVGLAPAGGGGASAWAVLRGRQRSTNPDL